MSNNTTIIVSKETRKQLSILKAQLDKHNYDELVNFLVEHIKNCMKVNGWNKKERSASKGLPGAP